MDWDESGGLSHGLIEMYALGQGFGLTGRTVWLLLPQANNTKKEKTSARLISLTLASCYTQRRFVRFVCSSLNAVASPVKGCVGPWLSHSWALNPFLMCVLGPFFSNSLSVVVIQGWMFCCKAPLLEGALYQIHQGFKTSPLCFDHCCLNSMACTQFYFDISGPIQVKHWATAPAFLIKTSIFSWCLLSD